MKSLLFTLARHQRHIRDDGLAGVLLLLRYRVNATWLTLGGAVVGLIGSLVAPGRQGLANSLFESTSIKKKAKCLLDQVSIRPQ